MARFREFRRRYLSFLPTAEEHRRLRGVALRRLGLARCREPRVLSRRPELRVDHLIGLVAAGLVAKRGELSFLQIGAYDGQLGDQLQELIERHPCRGVLVEPQPTAFARLESAYAGRTNLRLVNAAIDREPGERAFYMPKNRDSVLSSFNREHLVGHGVPPQDIVSEILPCKTVEQVLTESGIDNLGLLLVDTEGYDAVILGSIDLDRLQPEIIRFEYTHLGQQEADDCVERLATAGYRFIPEMDDLIAVRTEVGEERLAA